MQSYSDSSKKKKSCPNVLAFPRCSHCSLLGLVTSSPNQNIIWSLEWCTWFTIKCLHHMYCRSITSIQLFLSIECCPYYYRQCGYNIVRCGSFNHCSDAWVMTHWIYINEPLGLGFSTHCFFIHPMSPNWRFNPLN